VRPPRSPGRRQGGHDHGRIHPVQRCALADSGGLGTEQCADVYLGDVIAMTIFIAGGTIVGIDDRREEPS
jgi:hypothetical protein